MPVVNWED